MSLRATWRGIREIKRRSSAVGEMGFKPNLRKRCTRCNRGNGSVYTRGEEWFCIRCYGMRVVEPRDREALAWAMVPDGDFAVLSPGEPPPWERV